MSKEKRYKLSEIENRLNKNDFPFSGVTELGTVCFNFRQPSFYAATAIHAGSRVRPAILQIMEVSEKGRYQEEDPLTEQFTQEFPLQIVARDSRFEYDINRERERAIYATIKESWGIKVWKRDLTPQEMEITLAKHDEFHKLLDIVTNHLLKQNNFGVIFDCHSYNYQRDGRRPWYQDKKPDINLGTATVNRSIFGDVIDDLVQRLSEIKIDGHFLSIAENDIFKGGYVSRELCREHHDRLLVYAIEFKKIFMDEWSGEIFENNLQELIKQFSQAAKENMDHPALREPNPIGNYTR